ncbi:MAG: Gfo/Idh/MocA family oxidoreductase [Planctomycetota bacterium]|nr:Gfo/Idh/MocA family oxidoreductase [Planctomycetota bacterium]MDA1138784.1 Gfo/Idh/MocA family oxidoreductase [Planctomycetota bacterium]
MSKTKYRVAIIGTGRMGGFIEDELPVNQFWKPYSHFCAYEAIKETEVIAVANRGEERLKRFAERFSVSNTYLDYREMIEKEKPDIVSVTTPSFARAEPIIFCAEHGVRGIYSEKGLCASLEEADRITDACKRNNVAFNWGAMRRHHDGYIRLAGAIAAGDIGKPRYVSMYTFTDLIKHHPHTIDLVSMLIGDPKPVWVEGTFAEPSSEEQKGTRQYPKFDPEGNRFLPPEGQEIADPMVGYFRVHYDNGAEGVFFPAGFYDVEVVGSEGRAHAWENGADFRLRRAKRKSTSIEETIIHPTGESPTVQTVRGIIKELETGERTQANIDVTMQAVEIQFGLAHSHLQGGARVKLPVEDRSLYIPGG